MQTQVLLDIEGPDKTEVADKSPMPLAARMRPRHIRDIVGQEHLLAEGKPLRISIERGNIPSIIFWGPPGSGKTTLAEVIAGSTSADFIRVSAVSSGVAELRGAIETAKKRFRMTDTRTILFIDEIHRFNKAQQDVILPNVEDGTITLIGATTENPSFEVNSALLSRSRLFVLKALSEEDIRTILTNAIQNKEKGFGLLRVHASKEVLELIAAFANGDARTALNLLELAVEAGMQDDDTSTITETLVQDAAQRRAAVYDKHGDMHYDIISALHKSLRGSDPDASLYWLGRMIDGGEDPLYIMRRLIRFASEDVGMADPQALVVCIAAQQAIHFIGMPEASLALAEAVVYLATAPKSNALYTAYSMVEEDIQKTRNDPVPLELRNAPTNMMKGLGYGKGYMYAPDFQKDEISNFEDMPSTHKLQEYLPENIQEKTYYMPGKQGREARIGLWLEKRKQNNKDKK